MRAAAAAGLAPRGRGRRRRARRCCSPSIARARGLGPPPTRARRATSCAPPACCARCTRVAANAPAYAAERIARKYLAALSAGVDARRARFDARARKLGRRAARARAPLRRRVSAERALPQRSRRAPNVLDDGGLVLVDFEYAVRAAPVLDLAGLAGMNDYGERECRELLAAYYGDGPPRSRSPSSRRSCGWCASWHSSGRGSASCASRLRRRTRGLRPRSTSGSVSRR